MKPKELTKEEISLIWDNARYIECDKCEQARGCTEVCQLVKNRVTRLKEGAQYDRSRQVEQVEI